MRRQLRCSTQNKGPRPETDAPETEYQTDTEAPAVAQAGTADAARAATAVATVRANLTAIRTPSVESRTNTFA